MEENNVNIVQNNNNPVEVVSPVEPVNMTNPKNKKGLLIGLGIAIVALVALVVCYFLLFKGNGSPKVIYSNIIDRIASEAKNSIKSAEMFVEKPSSVDFDIKLNFNSTSSDYKAITDLINKMNIKMNTELDYKNKLANVNYDIKYNNKELLKALVVLNNQDMYIKSDDLYSKALKQSSEELKMIWEVYNLDDYEVLIDEISKTIKNNLQDKYFTVSNDGALKKVTLTMDGQNKIEFESNILDDLSKNEKVLTTVGKLTNKTVEEVKNDILESKNSLTVEEYNLVVNVWTKGSKDVEKISIKESETEIVLEKNNDKYDINVNMNGEFVTIGTLTMNNNTFAINIDYNGLKLGYSITRNGKNESGSIDMDFMGVKLNMKMEGNDQKGEATMSLVTNEVSGNIKMSYTMKPISGVSTKEFADYVDVDKIDDNTSLEIMQNLSKKEGFVSLYQDINKLSPYANSFTY